MIDKAFLSTDLFLLTLTVGLYCLGTAVYRRIRMPLLHPVLLTFVAVIVFLRAADIGYTRYQEATGILDFALGMSVVALGYLLYERSNNCAEAAPGRHRHPCGLRGGRAERRIYRHGVWRRARDTQLDSPQVGYRAHRRVGFGAAGRHRPRHVGRGVLRGYFRQYLRRVDPAPLRDAKRKGFCAGTPRVSARAIEMGPSKEP